MTRRRNKDKHLPPCVYQKNGAYWYVKKNQWTRLGKELPDALSEYARLIEIKKGRGMITLINRAHPTIIHGKADNTIEQYDQIKLLISGIFQEFMPNDVTPSDIAAIKTSYLDRQSMFNRILSYTKNVFNFAVEQQIVTHNPCIGIKRYPEKSRDRYITDTEFDAIRHHASANLRAILDIAYLTGQRISDVIAIRHDDITDDGIFFKQHKTASKVLILMSQELRDAINTANALPRKQTSEYLFSTERGGRKYNYATVRDMYRTAADRAGIKDARLNDTRAKSITDAEEQGLDPTALAGHTDARTTRIYLRNRKPKKAAHPTRKR